MYITIRLTGFRQNDSIEVMQGKESQITSATGQLNDSIRFGLESRLGSNTSGRIFKQTEWMLSST